MSEQSENKGTAPERIKACFNKYRSVAIPVILSVVIAGCWLVHISILKKDYTRQEAELLYSYNLKMDSLTATNKKMVSQTFAWAVRSEMIRRNPDQVNQYFLTFIREPDVLKILYMDADTGTALISTDKKEEGTVLSSVVTTSDTTYIDIQDSVMRAVTPVLGLNRRLGTLVVDYRK